MEDKQIVELYWARSETAIAETEKKYGQYFYMSAVAEIAKDYQMKESNVTMHLFRTRKKLEQFLKKEGFDL